MQTTPAPAGANGPATQPTGTLGCKSLLNYLLWATEEQQSAAQLLQLYLKRKPSSEREAILDGYAALKQRADEYTEQLRDCGGLLSYGCAPAVAAARRAQEARAT